MAILRRMEQWLIDNAALLVGYAGLGILWIWKGSAFIHKANDAFIKVDALDDRMGNLEKNVGRVEGYLHEVGGYMSSSDNNFPKLRDCHLIQSNSPITLTPQGEVVVNESGFAKFVADHKTIWDDIADRAKNRPDAESYIEKHVILKINDLFEKDDVRLADVSDYIYQNGLRESKIKQNETVRAFGVCARDFTLKLGGFTPPVAPPTDK